MKVYTKSRHNGSNYSAIADYVDGKVIVKKGSKINRITDKALDRKRCFKLYNDDSLFDGCILIKDIEFKSLSTAATFVTGRVANGFVVWKSEDGKKIQNKAK